MDINKLIQEQKWQDLISNYTSKEIAHSFSFWENLKLVYQLLYNRAWDENIQEFAVQLLEEVRNFYPKEWNSSWQYDAFLGLAYDVILKYDERYEALKRAFDKTKAPAPQLLIAMARCCDCPGKPPISYNQAIEYLKLALKDYLYTDGVGLMSLVYSLKGDQDNQTYWANVLKQIENKNIESPPLDPDFVRDKKE